MSTSKKQIGVNLPWINGGYGHDLGKNQKYPDWDINFNLRYIKELIDELNKYNVNLIRFWLFEDGEGLIYTEKGEPIGIDSTFLNNLNVFTSLLSENNISVYFTLFDANSVHRNSDYITKSILTNPKITQFFLEKCLNPILPIIKKNAWGIDLCNEPEAIIHYYEKNSLNYTNEWSKITSCFILMINYIKDKLPKIKIGIGSGYYEGRKWEEMYSKNLFHKLDLIDTHTYNSNNYISFFSKTRSSSQKIILGEIGCCTSNSLINSSEFDAWKFYQKLLSKKLELFFNSECSIAFVWYLSSINSTAIDSLFYKNEASEVLHKIKEYYSND